MNKLLKIGLINSFLVLIYCAAVATLITTAQNIFGKMDTILTGLAFLMLFVLSAAIVGSLIVAKPIMFYLDQKKTDAIKLLSFTLILLFAFTLIAFLIILITK